MEEKKSPKSRRKIVVESEEERQLAVPKTTTKKIAAKKTESADEALSAQKPRSVKRNIAVQTPEADETISLPAAVEQPEITAIPKFKAPKKAATAKSDESAAKKTSFKKSAAKTKKTEAADGTVKLKGKTDSRKAKSDLGKTENLTVSEQSPTSSAIEPETEIKAEPEIKAAEQSKNESVAAPQTDVLENDQTAEPETEQSAVFKQLAEPQLPRLAPENRVRLQIQSPTKIFLYWSIKNDSSETLQLAFGSRAVDYRLIVKLKNLSADEEKFFPIESRGSWWFDAEPNSSYQAEIGFYAAARPFVRLMFSNTVQTPRSAPSPNTDWSMDFIVSAEQFAEVLDAAGYAQDAFDVAIAGDDRQASDAAARKTFAQITGDRAERAEPSDLRHALFSLASGAELDSLREQISARLYGVLEKSLQDDGEKLSAENIYSALKENFVFEDDAGEFIAPVFGASSINFPKKSRRPKFLPISSFR